MDWPESRSLLMNDPMTPAQSPDAAPGEPVSPLRSRFLYELSAQLTPFDDVGVTPYGRRQICGVRSGWFAGPRLRGTIMPVGGEWALRRGDQSGRLDVRLTLKTDDDALIYLTYTGIMHGPKEVVRDAFLTGHPDPDTYYMRTTPYFETGSAQYDWLNRIVAVGIGRLLPGNTVEYSVHEIL